MRVNRQGWGTGELSAALLLSFQPQLCSLRVLWTDPLTAVACFPSPFRAQFHFLLNLLFFHSSLFLHLLSHGVPNRISELSLVLVAGWHGEVSRDSPDAD